MGPSTIQALLQPRAYPEPTTEVHLLQTHVSFLFFTDLHVYKIKKPVDFGFLNFTTLDRRRFYCNEEIRLNRRLCPDMYLGVVEVRDSPDGGSFIGNGQVLDYAVKMKRLPEQKMLHRLVSENLATPGQLRQVGHVIANFHLKAERSTVIAEYGKPEVIRQNWDENFQQLQSFADAVVEQRDLTLVNDWGRRFLEKNSPLFTDRATGGFIRDCDGDIHLDNICLTDQVCIFDCIEFNNRFRYSDTAADIAFLLMDLDFNGRSDLAETVLDEYAGVTGDEGALPLIPFYKTYRAMVRCKVECFRLNDPLISGEEKNAARQRGMAYLRLARRYALHDRLPLSLMLTCGLMGSGKSTVASALSEAAGVEAVSSDRVRKELAAIPEGGHDYSGYGKGIYTPEADGATYGELLRRAEEAIANGRSIIIDATFRRENDRRMVRSIAGRYGAQYSVIITTCPDEVARQRLEERERRPDEVSDGRWELYHLQQAEFENPQPDEGCLIFVDTSRPINATIDTILEEIGLLP